LSVIFNQEEVKHLFLPKEEIIYTYVYKKDDEITDMISFYKLPS